jgi:hypothetical protein
VLSERKRAEFERRLAHKLPAKLDKAILAHKKALIASPVTVATRKASELALDVIEPVMPELVMGSADLTPSNNTRAKPRRGFHDQDAQGPLCPLRHPRARHGRRDERHHPAWRLPHRPAAPSSSSPTMLAPRCGSPR